MLTLFKTLFRDEAGFILSAELILIGTVVTLAMVVGLAELAGSVTNEMNDMAGAVDGMNQGYSTNGTAQPADLGGYN